MVETWSRDPVLTSDWCSPPRYGEVPNEVCQTQYETSCVTRYKDTPVVEDVEECNKVKLGKHHLCFTIAICY